jgi:UDP-2-acetamido-2,6-beta-L-arabino-hexul-4-ose reductase
MYADDELLANLLAQADVVLHLAGVNRGTDAEVHDGNVALARQLVKALERAGSTPHVLFASSVRINQDTAYGAAKRECAEILGTWALRHGARYTTVILPNLFGEFGRPFYNSVTATFGYQLTHGEEPRVLDDVPLELLYAQDAAAEFLRLATAGTTGEVRVQGHSPILVSELLQALSRLELTYRGNVFPICQDAFQLALFNTLRSSLFPDHVSGSFAVHGDARGNFWEVVRSQGSGQTSVSTTVPGVTRGNHWHSHKVERFAVLEGTGRVRLRRLFTGDVVSCDLSGETPAFVDMPTFCTHSIENIGSTPLITAFWASELFDPAPPDTFAEPVLTEAGA